MTLRTISTIAIAPLVGDVADSEYSWLGASLGKLLTEHLAGAGLPVLHYNAVGEATLKLDQPLPLDEDGAEAVMEALKLSKLVAGGFRLKDDTLHLSLTVTAADATSAPLTDSDKTAAFAALVERVALALVRRLGFPADDERQKRLRAVPRLRNFEAFRQLVRARAAWADEDFPLALSLVQSARELEPKLEEAAEVQIGVARAASDPTAIRDGFERWAELAKRNGRPVVRAERLLLFGHWLLDQGAWDEAEDRYKTALSVFRQHGRRLSEAQALDNLAGLLLRQGEPDEAAATYRQSIAVYEMLGSQQDIATASYNLALAYKAQGETGSALGAINRVLSIARQLKESGLEAAALDQRGTILARSGGVQGAQADYEQALKLYEVEGNLIGLATVKDHLATLHADAGDHAAAEALHLEAVALFEQLGDAHELAVSWANLAALYQQMGAYDQAWDYAQRAHEVFTRLGSGMQQVTEGLLAGLS